MNSTDTIVAISSAVGPSARMIVRMSGGDSPKLLREVCLAPIVVGASRQAISVRGLRFPAWLYVFRSPRSYTDEDMVEFHIPGNALLARMLTEDLLRLGARAAEPGEFTARAYFNSKIDLTEAEGIAQAVAAQNESELAAARQLLAGELTRRLKPPMDLLAETLALVEVGIDFSDEDVSFLTRDALRERIARIDTMLADLLSQSSRFERLSHEPRIVLVGRPNAGKSTLLNALAGYDRAVVSPVAGTTRDAISAQVKLRRGFACITDVAGLNDTSSEYGLPEIERQMQGRARQAIEQADVVALLRDITDKRLPLLLSRAPDLIVMTKCDLCRVGNAHQFTDGGQCPPYGDSSQDKSLTVSAACGENMDQLRDRLDELAFGRSADASLALNARHLRAIEHARDALSKAAARAGQSDEFIAYELRESLDALGQILGVVSPDELLGQIFSAFCIGK